jgi:hypothetical protein
MTEHRNADILKAIAADTSVKLQHYAAGGWYDCATYHFFNLPNDKWRVKPHVYMVNGTEVPANSAVDTDYGVRIVLSRDGLAERGLIIHWDREEDSKLAFEAIVKPWDKQ